MKKVWKLLVVTVLLAVAAGALAACDTSSDYDNPAAPDSWGDVLIVYFSRTGTTENVAGMISDLLPDADVFEVVRAEPYPDEYTPTTEEAREELEADARPQLARYLPAETVAEYETVIFGYPVWWHEAPMPMFTFLDSYDLTGKNIVTFCTSSSSPISETTEKIVESAEGATVYEGRRFTRGDADAVRGWLAELGFIA